MSALRQRFAAEPKQQPPKLRLLGINLHEENYQLRIRSSTEVSKRSNSDGVVVADCSPVSEDSEYPGIADCPCSDVRFCDKTGSSTYMRNIHKDAILTGYVHQPRAPKGHKLAVCTTRRSLVQQLEQAMQDAKDVDIVLFWEYPTVTAAGIPWPKAAMRALTCGAGNGELLMAVYWNGTIARGPYDTQIPDKAEHLRLPGHVARDVMGTSIEKLQYSPSKGIMQVYCITATADEIEAAASAKAAGQVLPPLTEPQVVELVDGIRDLADHEGTQQQYVDIARTLQQLRCISDLRVQTAAMDMLSVMHERCTASGTVAKSRQVPRKVAKPAASAPSSSNAAAPGRLAAQRAQMTRRTLSRPGDSMTGKTSAVVGRHEAAAAPCSVTKQEQQLSQATGSRPKVPMRKDASDLLAALRKKLPTEAGQQLMTPAAVPLQGQAKQPASNTGNAPPIKKGLRAKSGQGAAAAMMGLRAVTKAATPAAAERPGRKPVLPRCRPGGERQLVQPDSLTSLEKPFKQAARPALQQQQPEGAVHGTHAQRHLAQQQQKKQHGTAGRHTPTSTTHAAAVPVRPSRPGQLLPTKAVTHPAMAAAAHHPAVGQGSKAAAAAPAKAAAAHHPVVGQDLEAVAAAPAKAAAAHHPAVGQELEAAAAALAMAAAAHPPAVHQELEAAAAAPAKVAGRYLPAARRGRAAFGAALTKLSLAETTGTASTGDITVPVPLSPGPLTCARAAAEAAAAAQVQTLTTAQASSQSAHPCHSSSGVASPVQKSAVHVSESAPMSTAGKSAPAQHSKHVAAADDHIEHDPDIDAPAVKETAALAVTAVGGQQAELHGRPATGKLYGAEDTVVELQAVAATAAPEPMGNPSAAQCAKAAKQPETAASPAAALAAATPARLRQLRVSAADDAVGCEAAAAAVPPKSPGPVTRYAAAIAAAAAGRNAVFGIEGDKDTELLQHQRPPSQDRSAATGADAVVGKGRTGQVTPSRVGQKPATVGPAAATGKSKAGTSSAAVGKISSSRPVLQLDIPVVLPSKYSKPPAPAGKCTGEVGQQGRQQVRADSQQLAKHQQQQTAAKPASSKPKHAPAAAARRAGVTAKAAKQDVK